MKRILVIQTAFLGDVILATPVVSALKAKFPASSIDILVKKGNESLLSNNTKIHTIYTLDKSKGKFKEIRTLISTFKKSQYDLVVNLHRFGSSGLIAGLSKGKLIIGFKKNPFSFLYHQKKEHVIGDGTHEVTRNLSLINEFTNDTIIRPELYPADKDFEKVSKYKLEKYYCLAPASVWFTKQLPAEKWIELIKTLPKENQIFLLGAPSDKDLCDRIIHDSHRSNAINLCGELSLMESAALMKDARRNYVNDSGPLHLASAMNAPVTSFFCSTVPDFGFGPLSDDNEIAEVRNLNCRPCGLHGHKECPKGHFKCGNEIEISSVKL